MADPLPSSRTVAIYGAGIAGLTVAHELARRGWSVAVYEANAEAGGFFRSARRPEDEGMPSEYSWHGFGPWYHNAFDVLKQIPADATATLYERALSRPIDFGTAPDTGDATFDDTGPVPDIRAMFRMTRTDALRWAWLMLKTWTADRRSVEAYSRLDAAEAFRPLLSATAWSTWVACFGPWIGSDWKKVSLHTTGLFFRRQLMTRPDHEHAASGDWPAWTHGARSGWLLLRGPSSEAWFDPWVRYLESLGVRIHYGQPLQSLDLREGAIAAGVLASGHSVIADVHVLAMNPFATADLLERTPALAALDTLRCFRPLVQDGPHTQVSFRIAYAERILWPRPRCAVIAVDSEFNLTLFAEEQAWSARVALGAGIGSLWTGTACVSSVPGPVHGLPLERCTEAQFVDEVSAQLARCGSLDAMIRQANGGRGLASFAVARIEVWHEWTFSPDGIRPRQRKWVTTTNTQPWLPTQRTPVANLVLAGAHTRTGADVWSIEGAVESGRRAARVLEPDVVVIPQYVPVLLRMLRAVDDASYALHGPHVLHLLAGGLLLLFVGVAAALLV